MHARGQLPYLHVKPAKQWEKPTSSKFPDEEEPVWKFISSVGRYGRASQEAAVTRISLDHFLS